MRPGPDDALQLAQRRFLAAQRIDVSALADELGVNRVTLYRWFGSRDRLLVEVVWGLARRALDDAFTQGVGIVEGLVAFLRWVIENPGMRRWLAEEGEHAMRLLTRHEPGFQPRLIAAVEELLLCDEAPAVDPHELAFVIVRVLESYAYLDLITGERADAARAEPILQMLLRAQS